MYDRLQCLLWLAVKMKPWFTAAHLLPACLDIHSAKFTSKKEERSYRQEGISSRFISQQQQYLLLSVSTKRKHIDIREGCSVLLRHCYQAQGFFIQREEERSGRLHRGSAAVRESWFLVRECCSCSLVQCCWPYIGIAVCSSWSPPRLVVDVTGKECFYAIANSCFCRDWDRIS